MRRMATFIGRISWGARAGWIVVFAIAVAALVGCENPASDGETKADGKIPVAVSLVPHQWLVEQVGGDQVDVLTLVQPGESPHTYQPSDAQVSRLMNSAIFFRAGVEFENGPWFNALKKSGKLEIVDVREGIMLRTMEHACTHDHDHGDHDHGDHGHDDHAHDHGEHDHDHAEHDHGDHDHAHHHHEGLDPHTWLSPRLLKIQARNIARALEQKAPDRKQAIEANLAGVVARLDEVDVRIREMLDPHKGKSFFVFHPAWGYFADEYGLEQVAIEVAGKEPTDHELTALQKAAREAGTKTIFVQPQVAGQTARAVAEAIGGQTKQADPLAPDVAENLLRFAEAIVASYAE